MTSFIIILLILLVIATLLIIFGQVRKVYRLTENLSKQRRIIRELNIINELSASLLSSLDIDYVIEILLDRSKELLKATRSAVVLLDKKGKIQNFYSSMGPTSNCKIGLTGILEKVYKDMIPVRGKDITLISGFMGFPRHHPDIKGIIVVPIILRGDVLGELIVTDKKDGEEFSSDDEDLLLTIAFYCAFAIEKVMLHNEILKMATMDGLTGLHNHRAFQEKIKAEIERAQRYGRAFSLLMLDLDRFKDFNDSYGHQIGDQVLKIISQILSSNIRGIDMAARYGGEEFAVILSETPLEGALATAERIRQNVQNSLLKLNGSEKRVTISIGVSSFPEDGTKAEELIESADKALYFSKRAGRNMVSSFRENN